ncbi:MAG: serine hydrolase domain-containing protein [Planctomycetota bacterium]
MHRPTHALPVAAAATLAGIVLLIIGWPTRAHAEDGDAQVIRTALGEKVDRAVQLSTAGGFWGAVLVAKDGEILLSKAYGNQDYATKPNTPDTLFELASLSKQFTAAAILKLQQTRKLKLSDTLGKLLRGADVPREKRDITVQQLLNHTSGLDHEAGLAYAWPGSRDEYIAHLMAAPQRSKPGEAFAYNNPAYALLAAIVEIASGQSFEDYLREKLFAPAGMTSTGFVGDARLKDSGRDSVRLWEGKDLGMTAATFGWGWGYRGMGGVVSTVRDMYRWDRALRGTKVLDADAQRQLFSPALVNYACGWYVVPSPDGRRAFHGGTVGGFRTMCSRWLDTDAVIIILSNDGAKETELERTIAAMLFEPARMELAVDASPYDFNQFRAAELGSKVDWQVTKDGGTVVLALRDGARRNHVAATIRVPVLSAKGLVPQLADAIAERERGERGKDSTDASLYLGPYETPGGKLALDEKLSIGFMPRYDGVDPDGTDITDLRVILIVVDGTRGSWPLMVRHSVTAAKNLLRDLRKATE